MNVIYQSRVWQCELLLVDRYLPFTEGVGAVTVTMLCEVYSESERETGGDIKREG